MHYATIKLKRYGRLRLAAQEKAGYTFVLPSLLILLLFVVVPMAQAVWLSLRDWTLTSLTSSFVGLANYQELLTDSRFWNALRNTLVYAAGVVPFRVGLGLLFAVLLNRQLWLRGLFRGALFLPALTSMGIIGIVWSFMLNPEIGVIPYYSKRLGLPTVDFLRSTEWALPAVIGVSIWRWFGFTMVIFLAALQGIPSSLYEAATVDGAGPLQQFVWVTLGMLRPTLLFVVVDSVIASLQVFDLVYVMTRGGPLFSTETLVTYLYYQGFGLFRMGYASAVAWATFLLIFGLTLVQLRYFRFAEVD